MWFSVYGNNDVGEDLFFVKEYFGGGEGGRESGVKMCDVCVFIFFFCWDDWWKISGYSVYRVSVLFSYFLGKVYSSEEIFEGEC